MQSGKILNCKAYVAIFRQPTFRDFLKQEVLPQLRLATLIQVKQVTNIERMLSRGNLSFV